jgi:hypothetical protein
VSEVDPANAQQNVGRENMAGSGEWPSPSTPPRRDQGAPGPEGTGADSTG